jgi:hypothetical protein
MARVRLFKGGKSAIFLPVFLFAVLQSGIAEAQQSLHEQAAGTIVERSFLLAGKVIPLPEGKFKLVHAGVRTGTLLPGARIKSWAGDLAEVVLQKSDGQNLQIVLYVKANLGAKSRWSVEPCKREEVLYRLDRAQSNDWVADCFTVNHQMGLLTNPSGIWVEVSDRLKADNVRIPLPLVLMATFTRIYQEELLTLVYYINPASLGYAADRGQNWATSPWHKVRIDADPEKAALVRAMVDWGSLMLPLIDAGFEGKAVAGVPAPAMNFPRASGKAGR